MLNLTRPITECVRAAETLAANHRCVGVRVQPGDEAVTVLCLLIHLDSRPKVPACQLLLCSFDMKQAKVGDTRAVPWVGDPPLIDIENWSDLLPVPSVYEAGFLAVPPPYSYDPFGELTVLPAGDHFEVTFPLPREQRAPRGPSYAVQVWIGLTDTKVLKVLLAS